MLTIALRVSRATLYRALAREPDPAQPA